MVKVDFAMVGIVSKCSPSLFSLLDKNIAIARSCDSTSNIPCNAREGKATNYVGRQNKGTREQQGNKGLGISVSNFPAFYEHNRERRNLLNGSKRLRKVEVRGAE